MSNATNRRYFIKLLAGVPGAAFLPRLVKAESPIHPAKISSYPTNVLEPFNYSGVRL